MTKIYRINKKTASIGLFLFCQNRLSHCAGHFVGTQATSAGVDMTRFTVDNRFDAFHVWFPSSVGSSVGMGHLDTKGNALTADITFSHDLHLL